MRKIRFYGIQIDKADYSFDNGVHSWRFTNPLNTTETITETLHNNRLKVQISQNGVSNNKMFNLAPSLYDYQKTLIMKPRIPIITQAIRLALII